ncbi:MAG: hypothetical protein ACXADY_11435 [Candidatus Hodarchaeales archaeon]
MSLNECPNCGELAKPNEFFCQSCGTAISTSPQRPRTKEIRGYIQIIGVVEIVFGIMGIIGSVFIAFFAVFIPVLITDGVLESSEESSMLTSTSIVSLIAILLGLIALTFLIFSIAAILSGIKLMQYKNSGRIGTMIIGAFSLFIIPVGTIFGVAALYLLTKPEVFPLFEEYSK